MQKKKKVGLIYHLNCEKNGLATVHVSKLASSLKMEDCNQTTSLSGCSSNLEEELTVEQFSIIMDEFYHKGHQWTSSYQRISTEEFQITLANVLGRSPRDKKIISLSSKASATCVAIYILSQVNLVVANDAGCDVLP